MIAPAWLAPILEWFHDLMAKLLEGSAADTHAMMAAQYRRRRFGAPKPTKHASARFQERWVPHLDRRGAHRTLLALCAGAELAPNATWANDADPWIAGDVRLVVRDGRLVTVLPMEGT